MRADIYNENEKKVLDAIEQVRNQTGQDIGFNRMVNLFLDTIETAELSQLVTITLKHQPEAGKGGTTRTRAKQVIKKGRNWAVNL